MTRRLQTMLFVGIAFSLAIAGTVPAQDDNDDRRVRRVRVASIADYWIGIHAVAIDAALRSHLKLEDRLIVTHVMPDSPAHKAGLEQHDILLKFGDKKITAMKELIAALKGTGGNETSVTVLRGGKEQTIEISPEKRPEGVAEVHADDARFWRPLEGWLGDKDANGWQRSLRLVGPGVMFNRARSLPNGVRISISKENDEPTKVTVQRGDDEWNVTADTIDELPEDLRDHVKVHLDGIDAPVHGFGRGIVVFDPDGDGKIVVDPQRILREKVRPQLEKSRDLFEKAEERLNRLEPFKILEERLEALRREVEKLRDDRAADDDDDDKADKDDDADDALEA